MLLLWCKCTTLKCENRGKFLMPLPLISKCSKTSFHLSVYGKYGQCFYLTRRCHHFGVTANWTALQGNRLKVTQLNDFQNSPDPFSTTALHKSNPVTGLDRSWGFQEVEATRFQDSPHMKVVRLSAPRAGRLYPPRKHSWYSFLLETELTPGP